MAPMAQAGEEGIGSMGNDSPLAVLSDKNKPLYNYFKQLFAQVTNPPIDPIREAIVMSLVSFIGPKPNLLDINQVNPPMRLEVSQPVLDFADMAKLRDIEQHTHGKFRSVHARHHLPAGLGPRGRGGQAGLAVRRGRRCDPGRQEHPDHQRPRGERHPGGDPGAAGLCRPSISIWCAWACAPRPDWWSRPAPPARCTTSPCWPAMAPRPCIPTWRWKPWSTSTRPPDRATCRLRKAIYNYVKAVGKGLSKIMSKMGVSTYMSYCGAQLFEAIGLNSETVDKYFTGTASRVEGIGVFEIAEEAIRMHKAAFRRRPGARTMLDAGGEYAWRVRGEEHMWTPDAIAKLQHSTRANNWNTYKEYAQLINDQSRRHMTLRGLFEFKIDPSKAIPVDEVEPASEIVKRFATGAMSLGSISTEAHATLAVAMNRIGGKSNTGEGGEDPRATARSSRASPIKQGQTLGDVMGAENVSRLTIRCRTGDSLRSRIKQVASGRFGVTAEYLSSADQIQIKMAQGAKPGEGGQLPGGKVSDYIGRLRYSVPGVGLISPPPHHDIYSIEDLAQLIHDLKMSRRMPASASSWSARSASAPSPPVWPSARATMW
jgi:glutamate synthase (NADPH/NADH) large chain